MDIQIASVLAIINSAAVNTGVNIGTLEYPNALIHIAVCNLLSGLPVSENIYYIVQFSSIQSLSRVRLFATLCDPMNHSMPGHPVHHRLPEFTQTHVH